MYFNADIIGEADPAADAELIALLINTLRELGLTDSDFVVRLSSRLAWQEFYGERATEPGRSYEFFQIVDKLEREVPERSDAALQALGFSLEAVREFIAAARPTDDLKRILDDLGARGLGAFVKVDYLVIRGLAYYTGPVFEAFDRTGEFRAIAGGGRYDNLLKLISGGRVDLPALGFGMGDVVLTELLKARGLVPAVATGIDVCVLVEDEGLRLASLRVVQQLRETGCAVDYSLTSMKPDKQFKRAVELGAAHTVRLARGEDGAISARVKNLRTREEQVLSPDAVVPALSAGARP